MMVKQISFTERIALMEAHATKIGNVKCSATKCKRKGFFVCRGGCGRTYCGHCGRGKIDIADMRAPEILRGTCGCYTCFPVKGMF
jgi:hypothetical protein